jgi:hypothetical protein
MDLRGREFRGLTRESVSPTRASLVPGTHVKPKPNSFQNDKLGPLIFGIVASNALINLNSKSSLPSFTNRNKPNGLPSSWFPSGTVALGYPAFTVSLGS